MGTRSSLEVCITFWWEIAMKFKRWIFKQRLLLSQLDLSSLKCWTRQVRPCRQLASTGEQKPWVPLERFSMNLSSSPFAVPIPFVSMSAHCSIPLQNRGIISRLCTYCLNQNHAVRTCRTLLRRLPGQRVLLADQHFCSVDFELVFSGYWLAPTEVLNVCPILSILGSPVVNV